MIRIAPMGATGAVHLDRVWVAETPISNGRRRKRNQHEPHAQDNGRAIAAEPCHLLKPRPRAPDEDTRHQEHERQSEYQENGPPRPRHRDLDRDLVAFLDVIGIDPEEEVASAARVARFAAGARLAGLGPDADGRFPALKPHDSTGFLFQHAHLAMSLACLT